MIPGTLGDIRGNTTLRSALTILHSVVDLDRAIEATLDAGIRDTDKMPSDVTAARIALTTTAAKVMAVRLMKELNYAFAHLEHINVPEELEGRDSTTVGGQEAAEEAGGPSAVPAGS